MLKKIKILFIGAELNPLIKVGGLADVMGALPKALTSLGLEVLIILPFYGSLNKKLYPSKLVKANLKLAHTKIIFSVYQTFLPKTKTKILLIKNKLFDAQEIYLSKNDTERFAVFSKCSVEAIKVLNLQPDLVHCHDWHTALVPTILDEYSLADRSFTNIPTLLTIHNLASQGLSTLELVDQVALNKRLTPALMEDYYDDQNKLDLLKIGILSADSVNTVSPTYAQEILTKKYGAGLEVYLQRRRKNLSGILNGIDVDIFNPQTDKALAKKYNFNNFIKYKPVNKQALQAKLNLPISDVPVFALISRLVSQKGLDILKPLWEDLLKHDLQIVILGTGEKKYEEDFKILNKKYPKNFKAVLKFDADLAQLIYAGSDFFLMPSSFEPCGLGQLISMRYGTLPIVRATGGLKDTVKHKKTGFVFSDYSSKELAKACDLSLKIFQDKKTLHKMIKNAMQEDFSWDKSSQAYLKLYKKLIK